MCNRTFCRIEEINEWDLKNIQLQNDYGEPLSDPDEPNGFSFVPEIYHEEMMIVQTAKYYNVSFNYLNVDISYDSLMRLQQYIKAFNYSYPKKRGQIPPGR